MKVEFIGELPVVITRQQMELSCVHHPWEVLGAGIGDIVLCMN